MEEKKYRRVYANRRNYMYWLDRYYYIDDMMVRETLKENGYELKVRDGSPFKPGDINLDIMSFAKKLKLSEVTDVVYKNKKKTEIKGFNCKPESIYIEFYDYVQGEKRKVAPGRRKFYDDSALV